MQEIIPHLSSVHTHPPSLPRYVAGPSGKMTLEKTWSKVPQPYALQTVVKDIGVHNPGYKMHLTPEEYFPPRTKVFMLGQPHYGSMGEVRKCRKEVMVLGSICHLSAVLYMWMCR